jgi:hypothetical protein
MTRFSKKDKVFIGMVVLVHAVFFLLACVFKRIYMGDSYEYIYEALNIKRYFFFYSGNPAMPIAPEYMTQRQPLYPLFLLGVNTFAINNWIVLLLQNCISVFNVCYLRKVISRLGYNQKYDWILLLLVIAYPAQFINANTIAPDILLQTCTLIYFGNFLALFQTKELRYAIYMSLALMAGMMVKPVLYPFALVHIFVLIAVGLHHMVLLQRTVLIAVLPIAAVLLYNYWNFTRTGKFHFTSNQAFNASYYYYPFISSREGADSAGRYLANEREAYSLIPEYKDRYDHANERGTELLRQNFLPYMVFHVKNSARIFIEPGKGEMDLFTGRLTYGRLYSKEQTGFYATWKAKGLAGMGDYIKNNPALFFVALVFLFNCIRLIGLLLFLRSRQVHWLVRMFVGYFALAAGPIANTRYFLPVSLIAIGCSVVGWLNFRTKEMI